jgi:aminotransferase
MNISKIAKNIEQSKGRMLFDMASHYSNVINLTLGDPDIIVPLSIRKAGCDAIMQGKTRYSANAGLLELRKVYANYLDKKYQRYFSPEKQIIVTVGGMEALYLAILSVINPDDEVIIFSPYYINYYQMIKMCGGKVIIIKTEEKHGYIPNIESVTKKINSRTKLIIINSPSNPTGVVYPRSFIDDILKIAKSHGVLIISDEVYSSLVFNDAKHYSVLDSSVDYDNILLIDSCSKKFSMTGWRIGFAAGSSVWIETMTKLQENIAACTPLPSQYAALDAFNEMPDMTSYLNVYQKRRDLAISKLLETKKLSFKIPQATFYIFINIEKTGKKSMQFAVDLLKEEQVAVVPGIAYGDDFDDYIRIALTICESDLLSAIDKIINFVEK